GPAPSGRRGQHAALPELVADFPSASRLHGGGAAHEPARAVTGAPEGLAHRDLGAHQEVRVSPHVTGNEHGLTGERARRALAMHDELAPGAVDLVLLFLRDVVRDVVDGTHAQIARGDSESGREDLARPGGT